MDCLLMYLHKKKKKTDQIRSRDRWAALLACLSVTLSVWEIIVGKFCHTDKS